MVKKYQAWWHQLQCRTPHPLYHYYLGAREGASEIKELSTRHSTTSTDRSRVVFGGVLFGWAWVVVVVSGECLLRNSGATITPVGPPTFLHNTQLLRQTMYQHLWEWLEQMTVSSAKYALSRCVVKRMVKMMSLLGHLVTIDEHLELHSRPCTAINQSKIFYNCTKCKVLSFYEYRTM
jgi:hypothetical protein